MFVRPVGIKKPFIITCYLDDSKKLYEVYNDILHSQGTLGIYLITGKIIKASVECLEKSKMHSQHRGHRKARGLSCMHVCVCNTECVPYSATHSTM